MPPVPKAVHSGGAGGAQPAPEPVVYEVEEGESDGDEEENAGGVSGGDTSDQPLDRHKQQKQQQQGSGDSDGDTADEDDMDGDAEPAAGAAPKVAAAAPRQAPTKPARGEASQGGAGGGTQPSKAQQPGPPLPALQQLGRAIAAAAAAGIRAPALNSAPASAAAPVPVSTVFPRRRGRPPLVAARRGGITAVGAGRIPLAGGSGPGAAGRDGEPVVKRKRGRPRKNPLPPPPSSSSSDESSSLPPSSSSSSSGTEDAEDVGKVEEGVTDDTERGKGKKGGKEQDRERVEEDEDGGDEGQEEGDRGDGRPSEGALAKAAGGGAAAALGSGAPGSSAPGPGPGLGPRPGEGQAPRRGRPPGPGRGRGLRPTPDFRSGGTAEGSGAAAAGSADGGGGGSGGTGAAGKGGGATDPPVKRPRGRPPGRGRGRGRPPLSSPRSEPSGGAQSPSAAGALRDASRRATDDGGRAVKRPRTDDAAAGTISGSLAAALMQLRNSAPPEQAPDAGAAGPSQPPQPPSQPPAPPPPAPLPGGLTAVALGLPNAEDLMAMWKRHQASLEHSGCILAKIVDVVAAQQAVTCAAQVVQMGAALVADPQGLTYLKQHARQSLTLAANNPAVAAELARSAAGGGEGEGKGAGLRVADVLHRASKLVGLEGFPGGRQLHRHQLQQQQHEEVERQAEQQEPMESPELEGQGRRQAVPGGREGSANASREGDGGASGRGREADGGAPAGRVDAGMEERVGGSAGDRPRENGKVNGIGDGSTTDSDSGEFEF